MAWTTPKTWAVDELVTASMLNTHLRDNLNALKAPPTASVEVDDSADYTTTSTTFTDVDAELELTITSAGGDLMVGFVGTIYHNTAAAYVYFNLALDDVDQAGDDGMFFAQPNKGNTHGDGAISFVYLLRSVSAGEHTITLRWKVSTGTATLFAGAGTSGKDVHPQLWVREIS